MITVPALTQVEDIAAEVAKQAKPQADKAAQIVRGTAQGIKEQAEPTAKVCCRHHPAFDLNAFLLNLLPVCSRVLLPIITQHVQCEPKLQNG